MSNTPGVTVGNDSTDVVDILGSVKEPAVQTIQSGYQRADDIFVIGSDIIVTISLLFATIKLDTLVAFCAKDDADV